MGNIFLLIALILNATANILMKLGSSRISIEKNTSIVNLFFTFITNPFLMIGLVLFASNVIFYIFALNKINLSIAYPLMTAGGFLLISCFTFFYLKEPINLVHAIGMVLIVIGIMLVASNLK